MTTPEMLNMNEDSYVVGWAFLPVELLALTAKHDGQECPSYVRGPITSLGLQYDLNTAVLLVAECLIVLGSFAETGLMCYNK